MSTALIPVEPQLGLARYQAMCQAIAECYQVDEVKELRDKAKALEVYAQQAQNYEAERKAAEIRIRAERRAGQLLAEMAQTGQRQGRGGDRKSTSTDTSLIEPKPAALKDLGISWDQSSKWQRLAEVPEEDFERAVTADGPKPSTEGIINADKLKDNQAPQIDLDALWIWGRLRDWERMNLARRPFIDLLAEMTEPMRADCSRITPQILSWLKT